MQRKLLQIALAFAAPLSRLRQRHVAAAAHCCVLA